MRSFYKCTFFSQKQVQDLDSFEVQQEELKLKSILEKTKTEEQRCVFSKVKVDYLCKFHLSDTFDKTKPCIVIPIRNNKKLLDYTIRNLISHNISNLSNIIIVDDRSNVDLKKTVLSNSMSYLRIDNEKGFNFSMINNIPAKIVHDLGCQTIIFWNSDLWCVKEDFFKKLLLKHKQANSKVSGAKLIYPPLHESLNSSLDTKNIQQHFPYKLGGSWRETVQFGGDYWIQTPKSHIRITPIHYKRFARPDNLAVSCDRPSYFVTGALHVWDLKYFIELGGFNPSLSKVFQDTDICLRTAERNDPVWYFGKDIYFYHDESYNQHNLDDQIKNDSQMTSDSFLFGKIWNDKIERIVF